jgi:hypothetical protein
VRVLVLTAVCLVIGAVAQSVAAAGPSLYLLSAGDSFDLAGFRIACTVRTNPGAPTLALFCFRETAPASYKPQVGSYMLGFAQGSVVVARLMPNGTTKTVFTRYQQHAPKGEPPFYRKAKRLVRGIAQLRWDDAVFVAGTDIGCVMLSSQPPQLLCDLEGADATPLRGNYSATAGDTDVTVSRETSGAPQDVFHVRDP